jgi:hypothetical protein
MTKIITRYFESAETAHAVRRDLVFVKRLSQQIVHVFEQTDGLEEAGVLRSTIDAYRSRLAQGGAVLLVQAGFRPLGVAQTTRDMAAMSGAVDMGGVVEEVTVTEDASHAPSIRTDHPLMMSSFREPGTTTYHMANWPIPLISRRTPMKASLIEPHARMADVFWPLTVDGKPFTFSLFDDHQRMANWPIPLISRRKPGDRFAFSRHARMANFPIPLISRRKPRDRFAFPRHQRMANWPFPLLINGKTGTNALMPGAPRMANFPIPLLSDRKPKDNFAFQRHARMANFPIGLISRRKPITASIFSRHARMANFPLPLVVRGADRVKRGKVGGAFFSNLFGLPMLARR